MAQSKVKKKASPAAKKPAAKPASVKKPAAKKLVASKKGKPAAKPSPKSKPKPAAKPKAKSVAPAKKPKPVVSKAVATKAKPVVVKAKPVPKSKPAPKAEAPSAKRAVAVSHRPQTAPVTVQARAVPAKVVPAAVQAASKPRQAAKGAALQTGPILNEDQIRRAPDSAYMNDAQLAFFQERLLQMRNEVLTRELDVKERLHQREVFADPADRASAEEEHWLDLRLRERESLLLKKIDDALRRIRDKDYGYCEKTGEAIGIARLLARPTATVCVDIKGQDERAESQYRDR